MTPTPALAKSLLVTHRGYVEGGTGGAQVCTREYIEVLQAAGLELDLCLVDVDARLSTRLLRKLVHRPYFRPTAPETVAAVASAIDATKPDIVFLNQMELATLASEVRRRAGPGCTIVALSHGMDSTDLLHMLRLRDALPLSRPSGLTAASLGRTLLAEHRLRADIDLVCALSPQDVALEQWVGAAAVDWLPRVIVQAPLPWRPAGGRLGYFGTLDHAPNLEGLVRTLEALHPRLPSAGRVRVVGGPERIGRWLVGRHGFVDFLGPLDDAELRAEASTWSAVMHPIFCHPRGCSTKLATAMGWQVPIVTTGPGRRGYEWGEGDLVIAEQPADFAAACLRLLEPAAAQRARDGVVAVTRSSPRLQDVAARMRTLLERASSSRSPAP